ncbi:hypothetical protein [Streptomyces sp. NPDC048611]|uniref:hypothetical protein n=1 Tax=Streptomyces sp. NPDC048611 TaxID=3155635 RepID=UPI0034131A62
MAALTMQTLSLSAGTAPTLVAAGATDTVNDCGNGSNMFLWYKNTNGSTRTITVTVPGVNAYGQNNPDPVYTIGATTGELMIPLRPEYIDSSGICTITPSATAGVTVAWVKLPA